jgi:glucosamine-6-phosphate deaminase
MIWRFDNANSLYYALLDAFKKLPPEPNLVLPTGNTMIPFYKLAAEHQSDLKTETWRCFQLDEYTPVTAENYELSFKKYLERHFLSSALVKEVYFFENFPEPADYEKKIKEKGGLDIVLLGLGQNGHIAFNEPGSEPNSRTRTVTLHPDTLLSNFKGVTPFTEAITLGIETILEAKKIYIVALGKNKAHAVKCAIKDPESRTCPASFLRRHPDVTWFLDQEASEQL